MNFDTERAKYRRIWATGQYGASPGLVMAPVAMQWATELGCRSLTDWGCGDGQAMRYFRKSGNLDVHGIDLVDVAPTGLSVVVAPISDPGELPATDFAFSADVLEHLHPGEVGPSLEAIRLRTSIGGFFQIATRPDMCGELIGEPLHLTVRPADWWRSLVGEYFDIERTEARVGAVKLWLRAR